MPSPHRYRCRTFAVFLGIVCALAGGRAAAAPLAFPGAEGYGRFATGGRGGAVHVVTNLNDSGPGSLRAAVSASGPRTVVFAVSGTIYLQSTLRISRGDLTIAGQTAPGDGICLAHHPLDLSNATNVIVRFLRVRLGDTAGKENDAFTCRFADRVIIDHCSFSWSVDECATAYRNSDFTLQWCMITESLRDSVHSKGPHGYGGIWGGAGASFHHNLLAHHDSRNPRFSGDDLGDGSEQVDLRNNVVYNWRGNSCYGGEADVPAHPGRHNLVGNTFRYGPATNSGVRHRILNPSTSGPADGYGRFHVSGNTVRGHATISADNWAGGVQGVNAATLTLIRSDTPFVVAPITEQSAAEAYELVLAHAGCSRPVRDSVDARIVQEVRDGTATHRGSKNNYPGIIDSQADVGGWPVLASAPAPADTDRDGMPDAWETARGLDPANAADRNGDLDGDGYTNLEDYLNGLVAEVFPVASFRIEPAGTGAGAGAEWRIVWAQQRNDSRLQRSADFVTWTDWAPIAGSAGARVFTAAPATREFYRLWRTD